MALTKLCEDDIDPKIMDQIQDFISIDIIKQMRAKTGFVFLAQIYNDVPLLNGDKKSLYIESTGISEGLDIRCNISNVIAFDKDNIPDELLDRYNHIKKKYFK